MSAEAKPDGKASAPTSATSGLALVAPPEKAETIQVEPLPLSSGEYLGHLTLTVKNETAKAGRVTVTYLRANGGRFDALAAAAPGSPVEPAAPIDTPVPILRPGQLRALQLKFTLPKAKAASWLDGALLLRLRKVGKKDAIPAPTLVPVKAEFTSLDGITFEPVDLKLQVTGGNLEGGGSVNLVGPGAEQLLDRTPPFEATVMLGNDDGNRASVTIDQLEPAGEGEVTGRVSVSDAEPGKYTGTLELGPGAAAPKLPITLSARSCILLAIGLVLLGSLLGGLLPAFSATARTRALLRIRLKSAILRLEEAYDSPENDPQLLWDVSVAMGSRPWLGQGWSSTPQVDGVGGLYTEVKWARNEDELKELGTEVDKAVGRIGRWLLVFERARELRLLLGRRVPERHGKAWRDTPIAVGAEEFLDGLSRINPPADKEARALALKCIERRRWYALVLEAWTKIARAERDEGLPDHTRKALGEKDLSPFTTVSFPTPAEISPLGAELAKLMREVIALVPEFDWSAEDPSAKKLEAFAVSATLPDQRHPNLLGGAAAESKRLEAEDQISAQKRTPEQGLKGLSVYDWLVTAALALAATFAYTVPLYTSTWGTTTDLLTALAAGFGTQVIVQWAGMPIFRAIRGSRVDDDGDGKKEDGNPATA